MLLYLLRHVLRSNAGKGTPNHGHDAQDHHQEGGAYRPKGTEPVGCGMHRGSDEVWHLAVSRQRCKESETSACLR